VRLRLERLDIAAYVKALGEGREPDGFKRAVKDDLQRRLDLYCSWRDVGEEGRRT
jgi:hypothetical protein